jgi:o-succinylbenzoate synthase
MNVESFSLPLTRPLSTADGTIEQRRGLLVRVTVDAVEGLGEATPLPGWTESLAACEAALQDVDDPVSAVAAGTLADRPAARHGVSLAVLDARARAAGEPLYRFLGAPATRRRVPVNATVGDAPASDTAAAAERAVAAGYPAVKLKVGARSTGADADRLAAVRARSPDVELRADANGAWDRPTARDALASLADHDIALVEQPLAASDLAGHAALRGAGVDVAVDEGLREHGIDAVVDAGAADAVVCKPMALGGVDVARDAALRAREAGLDAVVTTTVDGAVARAAAVHLAASLSAPPACGLATGDRLGTDLRDGVATVADGAAAVPQGKGNIPPR